MTLTTSPTTEVSSEELRALFDRQREAFLAEGPPSAAVRRNRIDRLLAALLTAAEPLTEALNRDFGHRPPQFSYTVEVLSVVDAANHAREHLEEWMQPIQVEDPATAYIPTSVDVDPLGVVGIAGPWNFPVVLVLQPAIEALAAGNRVMIKFSDVDPEAGAVLQEAVARYLSAEEVVVVNGGLGLSTAFSSLPFDHLLFTGSPAVGRIVQQAAAANLTPVTLELGGKNPVVVGHDADLAVAAERIAGSRLVNGGQVCLCPDYVFVPQESIEKFVEFLRSAFIRLQPDLATNPGVTCVVNDRNYDRVTGLIRDAVAKGARAVIGASAADQARLPDRATRRIAPTILLGVTDQMDIASEEIFGPVIAVFGFDDIAEPIHYVAHRPSPLVAYWYGEDTKEFEQFRRRSRSGGITRNDFAVHLSLHDVPFGGVGQSGMGAYHGKAGFDTFSHLRPVATSLVPGSVAASLAPATITDEGLATVRAAVDAALQAVTGRLGRYVDDTSSTSTLPDPSTQPERTP